MKVVNIPSTKMTKKFFELGYDTLVIINASSNAR